MLECDCVRQLLKLSNGECLKYDKLLCATGAAPKVIDMRVHLLSKCTSCVPSFTPDTSYVLSFCRDFALMLLSLLPWSGTSCNLH